MLLFDLLVMLAIQAECQEEEQPCLSLYQTHVSLVHLLSSPGF
jgi:hypothetical protein